MSEPVTIERLERALAVCAYIVVRHGPQYVPIYNRLEEELAAMHERENTVGRAKRLLETYGDRHPRLSLAPPLAATVFTAPRPNHVGSTACK